MDILSIFLFFFKLNLNSKAEDFVLKKNLFVVHAINRSEQALKTFLSRLATTNFFPILHFIPFF